MDKVTVLDRLNRAEDHVRKGSLHVANQKRMVRDLEADGHDTSQALALLMDFEELLAMHRADLDRLRAKVETRS